MRSEGTVLMLEDDKDDRFITQSALSELGYDVKLSFVHESTELYKYLEQNGKPILILLDFNSIPDDALTVLSKLKSDAKYKSIPVVVLGDSTAFRSVQMCYELGASSFILKPSSHDQTLEKIDSFFKYWLETAEVA